MTGFSQIESNATRLQAEQEDLDVDMVHEVLDRSIALLWAHRSLQTRAASRIYELAPGPAIE